MPATTSSLPSEKELDPRSRPMRAREALPPPARYPGAIAAICIFSMPVAMTLCTEESAAEAGSSGVLVAGRSVRADPSGVAAAGAGALTRLSFSPPTGRLFD